MRLEILMAVCPPGFDKPVKRGGVCEVPEELGAKYVKAGIGVRVNKAVTDKPGENDASGTPATPGGDQIAE